jgi:hypothetical protein
MNGSPLFWSKPPEYFLKGLQLLIIKRCENCITVEGDYIEKW